MNSTKLFILAIMVLVIWFISLKVVYNIANRNTQKTDLGYDYPFQSDTIVQSVWEFEHFQFYLKHVGNAYSDKAFTTIHLNASDKIFYLFDCHSALSALDAQPEKLYDDIYSFPYYTGGNYSRSSGIELFRVATDTVVYIGPVCGFEDMNSDGKKEFYVYDVAFFGEGQAFNIYDTIIVELIGDSLDYPFLDGSY